MVMTAPNSGNRVPNCVLQIINYGHYVSMYSVSGSDITPTASLQSVVWQLNHTKPPSDAPACGWKNEHCQPPVGEKVYMICTIEQIVVFILCNSE